MFVEHHVTRGDDASGCEVEAAVTSVIGRIADEHARCGPRRELVRCCGHEVGEAPAAEHAELAVGGVDAEEECVRRSCTSGAAGSSIDEIRRCGERFCPKHQRCCTV